MKMKKFLKINLALQLIMIILAIIYSEYIAKGMEGLMVFAVVGIAIPAVIINIIAYIICSIHKKKMDNTQTEMKKKPLIEVIKIITILLLAGTTLYEFIANCACYFNF